MTPATTTFPPETTSVPAARRFVSDTLAVWGLPAAADAAEMLVSELATNAVLHARTEFTVVLSRVGDAVRVEVLDLSRAPARQREYGTDATTGRGLRLVASLSSRWGVDAAPVGKAVWFEVPCDGAADLFVEAWEGEADVDALLAAFEDGADVQVCALSGLRAAA